jgi:hypothetical protein
VSEPTMTPKQAYERRRAEREAKLRQSDDRYGSRPSIVDEKDAEITDILNRFVTAVERIANALESQP